MDEKSFVDIRTMVYICNYFVNEIWGPKKSTQPR